MKKIIIITPNPINTMGGVQNYTRNFIDVTKGEYDVKVISLQNGKGKDVVNDNYSTNFIIGGMSPKLKIKQFFWVLKARRRIKKIIFKNSPSLVINQINPLFIKPIVAKKYDVILRTTLSPDLLLSHHYKPKGLIKKILHIIFRINNLSDNLAGIITYSMHDSEKYRESRFKCTVSEILPPSSVESKASRWTGEVKSVGWIGRFDQKQKDIKYLVRLADSNPELKFIIAGGGVDIPKAENITVVGKLKTHELNDFYDSIDTLVMTSNFEGFGMVALENLSRGNPVLLPNKWPAAKTMTIDHKTGILFSKENDDMRTLFNKLRVINSEDIDTFNGEVNNINIFRKKWIEFLK